MESEQSRRVAWEGGILIYWQDGFEVTPSLNGAPIKPGPSRQISLLSAPKGTNSVQVKEENSRVSDVRNTHVAVNTSVLDRNRLT
jgi:hypothetical protein